eukprot:Polyplicarium_translucidae@DN1351_c0_g1_i1.p1
MIPCHVAGAIPTHVWGSGAMLAACQLAIGAMLNADATVLAEQTDSVGNFQTVTRKLLSRLSNNQQKMSYTYDRYMFHCVTRGGLTFLVMSTKDAGVQVPYAFLDEVSAKFLDNFATVARTAIALSLDSAFAPQMRESMALE